MGRRRNNDLPKGNFVFKNKANAKGKRTLYLRYYVNTIEVMTSTGVSLAPNDWDSDKEVVKSGNISHERFNESLQTQREQIDARIANYQGRLLPRVVREIINGGHLTPDEVKRGEKFKDFIEYAFAHNQRRYDLKEIAFSTYHNDNYHVEQFRTFITRKTGESVILFNELSTEIFEAYKQYWLAKGNQKQSINRKLKPLYKAIDYAAKSDLISPGLAYKICYGYFPLRDRSYKPEVPEEKVRYLTQTQFQEFEELYPFMSHPRTREFMDLFLFSFHACGLRFSDMLTLEWQHVNWEKKCIRKNLYKEKVAHTVPLDDPAMEILMRWKGKRYNSRFVFNMLPADFDLHDQLKLDNMRKSKNRALQTSLREVGRKLPTKLSFSLSIHVARHTFVVMALNNGMSIYALSKVLGHRSVAATERYYAHYLYPTLAEEVRSKMNKEFKR